MTAKEKASILFTLMWGVIDNVMPREEAKRCALIAVDEILNTNTLQDRSCGFIPLCEKHTKYWQEVKTELEKL